MWSFGRKKQYGLYRSEVGDNYLGGDVPVDFTTPKNTCPGSFQYLGLLNKLDPAFTWLPFNFHMICPIYSNMNEVWLDYTNPLAPIIINAHEINRLNSAFESLTPESIVIYEKVNFSSKPYVKSPDGDDSGRVGIAGIPRWIQEENIPRHPRTKEKLKFLCQLEYQFRMPIKTKFTNVVPEEKYYLRYFEEMNFWGSGDLYVFFDDKTKAACYFIQNT